MEHRIEFVRERTGVRYYNDSKGTNPDAAIQALRAMPGPTLLIAGGYDKNSEYDEWVSEFEGKVRYLVLIAVSYTHLDVYKRQHRIRRNQERAMYMDLPYVIMLTIASVFTLYLCINYLHVQSSITARMHHIEQMEAELEDPGPVSYTHFVHYIKNVFRKDRQNRS